MRELMEVGLLNHPVTAQFVVPRDVDSSAVLVEYGSTMRRFVISFSVLSMMESK